MWKLLIALAPIAVKVAIWAGSLWATVTVLLWFHAWLTPLKAVFGIAIWYAARRLVRVLRSTEHGSIVRTDGSHRFVARPTTTPGIIVRLPQLLVALVAVSAVVGLVTEWQTLPWWLALLSTGCSIMIVVCVVYFATAYRMIGLSSPASGQANDLRAVAGWKFYQPMIHSLTKGKEV